MLMLWPFVSVQLFRRFTPDVALVWTVLGGYLLLPPLVALNLPLVPDLNKESIPNLTAAAIVLFALRERISILPASPLGKMLILLFVLSPFATVLTNGDPVDRAHHMLPGMRIYDSVAAVTNQAIALLPFFLARRYLAEPRSMRVTLVALVLAGLAYSIPMLIEVRLSPQLNVWIYGFFQHDFFQTIRFGGYRPVVFLPHGLWVAFFTLMCVLSAAALWRFGTMEERPRFLLAWVYLVVMLVLCKSAGPLVYAVTLTPLILLAPVRLQVILAAALAVIVISYPLLRGAHLVPLETILGLAELGDADRAHSLAFRIANEEALLDRASLKPWFGWGGYGRNLIYDEVSGRLLSISDGAWIIVLGIYGWLGYIAQFGLLALPLLLIAREVIRNRQLALSPHVAAVALILAANLADLLPNATLIPFTWLLAGALLGHAEMLMRERRAIGQAVHGRRTRRVETVLR